MVWMLLLALVGCDDTLFTDGEPVDDNPITADWDGMQTLFLTECLACHGAGGASGSLDLETDACAALVDVPGAHPAYGDDPRVAPGDHKSSILWHKIAASGTYGGQMPPSKRLSSSTADAVAEWIDAGAACESEARDTGDTGTDGGRR